VRGERSRHAHPARLPWRRADYVEDAVAWLLTSLGLLATVFALVMGVRLYDESMQRALAEGTDRTQVQAVLLEPAPSSFVVGQRSQAGRAGPVPVPARYTAPDGVEHVADVWVVGPRPAGTPVPIWVDRAGAVTTASVGRADALRDATFGATAIVVPTLLVLGAVWVLVHLGVGRANLSRWQSEWAQVEPAWSRRPPS
jgi:hypothetical protein